MEVSERTTKDQLPTFLDTNLEQNRRISDGQDNLSIFINNIILYCNLIHQQQLDSQGAAELRDILKGQLNELWF